LSPQQDFRPAASNEARKPADALESEPAIETQRLPIGRIAGRVQPATLLPCTPRHVFHQRAADPLPRRVRPHDEQRDEDPQQEVGLRDGKSLHSAAL
jgi:hypothetical protein